LPDEHYSTTWIGREALRVLETWEGGGHLLMVGFIKPHHPFDEPPPWSTLYNPDDLDLLPGWLPQCSEDDLRMNRGFFPHESLTPAALQRVMAQYYASITHIDTCVGEMVALLRARGLYDDTLIIYAADHGDYMGFHHLLLKGNYMYDPLTRVPLIVKHPGDRARGQRDDRLVSLLDVMPTIAVAADGEIPREIWGTVQPLDEDHARDYVFAETLEGDYMVRSTTHKLLYTFRDGVENQLIDLVADPLEQINLYDNPARRGVRDQLMEAFLRWLAFDARGQAYVWEDAPTASPGNALRHDSGHRPALQAYFARMMRGD
jgi:arylsulfatase A-like enzyme